MYMGAANSVDLTHNVGTDVWGREWRSVAFKVVRPMGGQRRDMDRLVAEIRALFLKSGRNLVVAVDEAGLRRLPEETLTIKTNSKAFLSFRWPKGSKGDICLRWGVRCVNRSKKINGALIPVFN